MASFKDKFHWPTGPKLGSGAFAVVYPAVVVATGEPCALKIVNLEIIGRHAAMVKAQALREIEVLSTMSAHPFILSYYGSFVGESNTYLAIELAPRGSLQSYVDSPTWHSGAEMSFLGPRLAAELLVALEHVHAAGFAHRDVKPDNALLSSSLHVKLSDFGTAARLDCETELRSFAGTWEYAAPELLERAGKASIASDVWAFVCTVYALFAGSPPFGNGAEVGEFELRRRIGCAIAAAEVDALNVYPASPAGAGGDGRWDTTLGWCEEAGLSSIGVRMGDVPHAVVRLMLRVFVEASRRPTLTELTSDPFFASVGVDWQRPLNTDSAPSGTRERAGSRGTRTAASALLRLSNETALNQQHTEQCGAHLLPGESVVMTGFVVKRRYLSRKTRLLALTTNGRLLWLNPDTPGFELKGQLQLPVCDAAAPSWKAPDLSPSPASLSPSPQCADGHVHYDPTPLSPQGHPEAVPFRRTPIAPESKVTSILPISLGSPKRAADASVASPEALRSFALLAKSAAVFAEAPNAYSFNVVTRKRTFNFHSVDPTAALWRDRINAFSAPWLVAAPPLPRWRAQRAVGELVPSTPSKAHLSPGAISSQISERFLASPLTPASPSIALPGPKGRPAALDPSLVVPDGVPVPSTPPLVEPNAERSPAPPTPLGVFGMFEESTVG